ncbi:MAG: hypothetical protein RBS43_07690, partial [Candidatus Cloacimonas sp.]|nr:hypothetical protein [Candidatus Cloacimonas sp.]
KQDVKAEFVRLNEIITKILETGDHQTELILAQIEGEQMEHEIENSLKSAEGDRDSADKCKNRLLDLQSALDNAEDALEWPTLLIKADESIEDVGTIVTKYGSNDEKSSFDDLSKELRSYIVNHEPDLLRRNIDMLESLRTKVLLQQPGYWVNLLDLLVDAKAQMNGTAEANLQISKGKEAIQNNDIDELKKAVNRLFDLLPSIEREKVKGFGGGTIK